MQTVALKAGIRSNIKQNQKQYKTSAKLKLFKALSTTGNINYSVLFYGTPLQKNWTIHLINLHYHMSVWNDKTFLLTPLNEHTAKLNCNFYIQAQRVILLESVKDYIGVSVIMFKWIKLLLFHFYPLVPFSQYFVLSLSDFLSFDWHLNQTKWKVAEWTYLMTGDPFSSPVPLKNVYFHFAVCFSLNQREMLYLWTLLLSRWLLSLIFICIFCREHNNMEIDNLMLWYGTRLCLIVIDMCVLLCWWMCFNVLAAYWSLYKYSNCGCFWVLY